jgi:DNA ligase-1
MKKFAALYRNLDETTKTGRKLDSLREYFQTADPADAAWAVSFLCGRKPKRLIRVRDLAQWCMEEAGITDWLFDECHEAVGDLAEVIALLLPEPVTSTNVPLHVWVEDRLLPLRELPPEEQRPRLVAAWHDMNRTERLVWNKLLTGEFRVGVSQGLVVRALAIAANAPAAVVAHRLMGDWEPSASFYRSLLAAETDDAVRSRPYPFCLAHPLEGPPQELGDVNSWLAEWKWDGIRAQLIRRQGETAIWSRGEELVTERFPELHSDAVLLPDGTVLDGEVVAWKCGQVMPFGALQRRIGRKALGPKILHDIPVHYIAFDLLEIDGHDVRSQPLRRRRELLESVLGRLPLAAHIMPSPIERATSWEELEQRRFQSRERNVEGLMLKSLDAPYGVGRITGVWWKWKVNPYTIDAVLVYAQRGHGRRASLYTDYTFAVWDQGELVPFAKAYSGLTDDEIREVDRFVRQNTLEKFGPVRRVKPQLVFELAFENIQLSKRHKSGIAVRFPRMARWRTDKTPDEADSLDAIRKLIRGG